MNEVIRCPFCDSDKAVVFRERADIVRCIDCRIVYLRTRPTQDTMYQIYQAYANETSHMKPPDNLDEAKRSGLRREAFVAEVIGLAPGGDAWLDVGCGWGALLSHAREKGFAPTGIELTRNCLDYAAVQLKIPVSNSQLNDSRIDAASFDIVSMVHVFEHLPYPRETLQKVHQILKPGGFFCGIVPNIASFCSELERERWVWLDETHHYVHYSPDTLRDKLTKAGFHVKRLYTSVGDFDYGQVMQHVRTQFLSAPGKTDDDVLARIRQLEEDGQGEEIRFFAQKV